MDKEIMRHNGQLITQVHSILSLISYFEDIDLAESGNAHLKELAKSDLNHIRKSLEKGVRVSRPWNVQDEIRIERFYEVDTKEFEILFQRKFEQAKENKRFKTAQRFAEYEHAQQKVLWNNHRLTEWFPIADQWLVFLEEIQSHGFETTKSPTPFAGYLTQKGLSLLTCIKEEYHEDNRTSKSKKIYAYLLIAMREFNLLEIKCFDSDHIHKDNFHIAFNLEFGDVGDRSGLFRSIDKIIENTNSVNTVNRKDAESKIKEQLDFLEKSYQHLSKH